MSVLSLLSSYVYNIDNCILLSTTKQTTIRVNKEIRDELSQLGRIGMTYNEVLTNLLKSAAKNESKPRQQQRRKEIEIN